MIARMAIVAKDVVKRYGNRRALDGFTLNVPAPCILGLVGPNGSGKTTWMMSVAGLIGIDSGSIGLFGSSHAFEPSLHTGRLAILPQDSELPLESTTEGFLFALARLQGLSTSEARRATKTALEEVDLADRAKASIRSLSHGMRKRLMTAQCFLGNPELVLLDEPMNGLDPEAAMKFRQLILSKRENRTIIISSHNLVDLERLCTHIAFIDAGKVVRFATLSELTANGATLEGAYLSSREATFKASFC